jgi:membrane protein required for colicin V production
MVIDIILIIFMIYGFWIGFSKGIIGTVFTVLSYVFGGLAAMKLSPSVTRLLEEQLSPSPLMFILGIILTFIGTMALLRLIGRSLEGVLQSVNINIINQIMGGTLSAAFMILIFSILMSFGEASKMVDDKTIQTSMSYPYVKEFPKQMKVVFEKAKPIFLTFWDESTEFMDRVEEMTEKTDGNPDIFDIEDTKPND